MSDTELLSQCEVDTYRASGPGGQKRNKTSSAVRLRHKPSGLLVIAEESRSQHENKARALRRLHEKIAANVRLPIGEEIDWPDEMRSGRDRLAINDKNPLFPRVAAIVLDIFSTEAGQLSATAKRIEVSSSALTKFLARTNETWAAANQIRAANELKPLRQS